VNVRPFNFQWFVPARKTHYVGFNQDGGMYVGPSSGNVIEVIATLHGGDGAGSQGRLFQIVGNEVPVEPLVAPIALEGRRPR